MALVLFPEHTSLIALLLCLKLIVRKNIFSTCREEKEIDNNELLSFKRLEF